MVFIAYINLARRTDRRATMEAQFDRLGLDAERIEAITPADIPPALIERHTSRRHVEHVRLTELSCTLSHHKALKAFLATEENHALILEDDVVLAPAVKSLIATDLAGFDILRLETFFDPQHHFRSGAVAICPFKLHRIASRCAGTAAYIVNRHAASDILRHEAARSRSYDFVLFFPFRPPGSRLAAMQVIPALAAQDHRLQPEAYASDIQQAADTRPPKPAHLRPFHAIAEFWLSDLSINLVKTANRALGRTRREVVPVSLD
ncbi:hypothetical protein VW35_12180 [Devosia soli]|uniref:Glycosyl transferase family 25 domain-containing protein n=1 Tax=Devosia soli TaxID=361041 RepID=A0A0F5L7J8_9HYPH|nr:glycosyltransferase family 25 protein [Devosia soli]KKB78381.1 hypothetical protein VW35_12180 [Devosia soli]